MTSNIGARDLKDFGTGVGFSTQTKRDNANELGKGVISKALKRTFSPEFLNRIDDIVIFDSLTREDIYKIIDILLKGIIARLKGMGYTLKLTKKAKEYIADKGYDPAYGARPLHRAIQKYLEDPLAEEILKANITEGDSLQVDYSKKEDKIVISVKKTSKKKAEKE